jgi:hypothetical protein
MLVFRKIGCGCGITQALTPKAISLAGLKQQAFLVLIFVEANGALLPVEFSGSPRGFLAASFPLGIPEEPWQRKL